MKEGIIKDTFELIIKEIQSMLFFFYIIGIGIGMLFNYQKYNEFKINIFDYADVFDYLITPISDGRIILFTLISLSLVFLLFSLDKKWQIKYPNSYSKITFGLDKKKYYKTFTYIAFSILTIFYLFLSAGIYGKITKREVLNKSSISLRYVDNEIKTGKFIGKMNNIVFLWKEGSVEAIPISNLVKEIRIE